MMLGQGVEVARLEGFLRLPLAVERIGVTISPVFAPVLFGPKQQHITGRRRHCQHPLKPSAVDDNAAIGNSIRTNAEVFGFIVRPLVRVHYLSSGSNRSGAPASQTAPKSRHCSVIGSQSPVPGPSASSQSVSVTLVEPQLGQMRGSFMAGLYTRWTRRG
jgi:hypothetical protein